MNSTEIIREICDAARRRAPPEILERVIKRLLENIPQERRADLRLQIDNAIAAVHREMKKIIEVDLSHLSRKPPKEKDP